MFLLSILGTFALAQNCQKVTVRKEVNDLSEAEWKVFIDTIKLAQATKDPKSTKNLSYWEEGAEIHNKLASSVHWTCHFFFWHRAFLVDMEKKLQKLNPDFFFPYWDSTREWAKADDSIVWKKLGSNGTPLKGDVFENKACQVFDKSPLRRGWTTLNRKLVTAESYSEEYDKSLRNGGFGEWSRTLEVLHGTMHIEVGGRNAQIATMYSPVDPVFYLHHGHLDYHWSNVQAGWVAKGMAQSSQYGANDVEGRQCTSSSVIPGYGNKQSDFVEIRNACVRYANPGDKTLNPTSTSAISSSSAVVTSTVSSAIPTGTIKRTSTYSASSSSRSVKTTSQIAKTTDVSNTQINPVIETSYVETTTIALQSTYVPTTSYPDDHVKIDRCPAPLPEEWLQMVEKGSKGQPDIRKIQEQLHKDCLEVVEKVTKGEEIPHIPIFKAEEKPYVAPPPPTPVEVIPDYSTVSSGNAAHISTAFAAIFFLLL